MKSPRRPDGSEQLLVSRTQIHSGLLPPAETLDAYARIIPDAPQRLLALVETEAAHRRALEQQAQEASVRAQQETLDLQRGAQRLAEMQTRKAFISDAIGQGFGLVVALACVGGAVYLAARQPYIAGLLAVIPSAAVIRAFFARGT